ncbi:MAG: flavin reductase [Vallitalea sp.]|nr:flavin reductase [Vallitalea sp.]
MKRDYSEVPESMRNMETYGFSWMDFVTAIPSPLLIVTSYKSNGKANACLQSWATFSGDADGFYAILSSVNRQGHMYETLKEKGVAVLNFPNADIYDKCLATIANNRFELDEIEASGLSLEAARNIDAPRIKECFLNLECQYLWEHKMKSNDKNIVICLEIVNIAAEDRYLDELRHGRYGENGLLYNIHYPVNPEEFKGKSGDSIAILKKFKNMGEY